MNSIEFFLYKPIFFNKGYKSRHFTLWITINCTKFKGDVIWIDTIVSGMSFPSKSWINFDFILIRFGLYFWALSLLYFSHTLHWRALWKFPLKTMWSDNESSRDSVVDLTDSPPLKTKKRKRETFTTKPVPKVSVVKKELIFAYR